jgi:hypothetical protein
MSSNPSVRFDYRSRANTACRNRTDRPAIHPTDCVANAPAHRHLVLCATATLQQHGSVFVANCVPLSGMDKSAKAGKMPDRFLEVPEVWICGYKVSDPDDGILKENLERVRRLLNDLARRSVSK